jgi:hypothetical protein
LATGANVINILRSLLSALAKEARIKGNVYAFAAVTYLSTTVIYSRKLFREFSHDRKFPSENISG